MPSKHDFQIGDWVVYRKTKFSNHPGPRAHNLYAARNGDQYTYTVDKFWVVAAINEDGMLLLQTRRGKQHTVRPNDPLLRHPTWLERWRYRTRFPSLSATISEQAQS
ncbi:MAG: hypothetical protein KDA85_01135 [Planctomycetaceae bacterium]|nr:hypothetical protein [Planctomycetaceae bacterium]